MSRRSPSQLIADFRCVDGIAAVMSEAIRHESDETPARAKRTFGSHFVDKIANGPHHFKILPFAVPPML